MIYQITYNEAGEKRCMKGAKVIKNQTLHPSFENAIIAITAPTINDKHFGIFSHKFKLKHPAKKYTVDNIMEEAEKVDVLSFFGKHKQKNQVNFLSQNMKFDFNPILEKLLKGTGYLIPDETKFVVYGNTFVAKKDIYHDYVKTMLQPALINSRMVMDDLWRESNYKGSNLAIGELNTKYKKRLTKYPLWPFIFECLFSIYLSNNDYDCKHF